MDYEIENIELRNALKLAHARIKDLEENLQMCTIENEAVHMINNVTDKDYTIVEQAKRIKELEAQGDKNSNGPYHYEDHDPEHFDESFNEDSEDDEQELGEDEFGQIMYK